MRRGAAPETGVDPGGYLAQGVGMRLMRMDSPRLRRVAWGLLAATYVTLWIATAVRGIPQADRDFDEALAYGSEKTADGATAIVPVRRVAYFDARDPGKTPSGLWRCRSGGIAIAPCLIIDRAAWHIHPGTGYSGIRLVTWLFERTRWKPITGEWKS